MSTVDLRSILARLRQGDASARETLYEQVYRQMRRIAGRIFHESFPRLRNHHDVTSVVHDVWIKLDKALDKIDLASEEDFFRFVAFKIRQVMYDLAARVTRRDAVEATVSDADSDQVEKALDGRTTSPMALAQWTEFHQAVGALPESIRGAFELHYYVALTRTEIAELLHVDRRKVHQLLVLAREHLLAAIPDGSLE